jgi:hypothetical protein
MLLRPLQLPLLPMLLHPLLPTQPLQLPLLPMLLRPLQLPLLPTLLHPLLPTHPLQLPLLPMLLKQSTADCAGSYARQTTRPALASSVSLAGSPSKNANFTNWYCNLQISGRRRREHSFYGVVHSADMNKPSRATADVNYIRRDAISELYRSPPFSSAVCLPDFHLLCVTSVGT